MSMVIVRSSGPSKWTVTLKDTGSKPRNIVVQFLADEWEALPTRERISEQDRRAAVSIAKHVNG